MSSLCVHFIHFVQKAPFTYPESKHGMNLARDVQSLRLYPTNGFWFTSNSLDHEFLLFVN